ncbi:hypothetical protein B0A52_06926 [Exophiala mesophila]|uniref:Uncharacterized protein n=1 Tax=Exophiala mesophila TaxID=212818 RepID=A0A438N0S4_EXOME|nr:hypothetical protein B0A52_06926 [Exophiala mesophila]
MNLLTRKSSNKSAGGSTQEKRSNSADRGDAGNKPSLLHRLGRRNSGSRERESTSEHDSTHLPKSRGLPRLSADPIEKAFQPEITEVHPETSNQPATPTQDTVNQHPEQSPIIGQAVTTVGQVKAEASTRPEPQARAKSHKTSRRGLTKDDVHQLFSGAPQFVLEKGRRGRYFPQAFFPWNNELDISDLQDRRYLRHESFALATLHAHLPIPDEVHRSSSKADPPSKLDKLGTGKRPMFEIGVFERPNMLSVDGKEPGTVGMRYFLERPVADGLQDDKVREHGKDIELDLSLANAPALEAFKMLAIGRESEDLNAKIGKHAPTQDRVKLFQGGPHVWKAVGVREITMELLAHRLEVIHHLRDEVVEAGWRTTILDRFTSSELHHHLFSTILFPPKKLGHDVPPDKAGLKVQIEALVKVLTTPGAWLDLSVPEARLRFGKILHSRTTYYDHDTGHMTVDPERKWLLIQMLLAVELVVRLDAALRLGVALHSESFELKSDEIHHFNKLRNLKVDWDLVAARRFLGLSYVKTIRPKSKPSVASTATSPPPRPGAQHHGSFLGKLFSHSDEERKVNTAPSQDDCDITILPRQPEVMVEGLIRFADFIGWPRSQEVRARLSEKLCQVDIEERERFLMDAMTCESHADTHSKSRSVGVTRRLGDFYIDLHAATPTTIGGWVSHSWLSGLILPGSSICDILIGTLLENDTAPHLVRTLGWEGCHPLRGSGFICDGSSWWSKSSIVGRVMAASHGTKESMGWIWVPNFVPLYEATKQPLVDRWVKLKTYPVATTRSRPRIFDGDRLAEDSTPLGVGKGGIMSSEFSMLTDHVLDHDDKPQIEVRKVEVHLASSNATDATPEHPLSAWASFELLLSSPPPAEDSGLAPRVVSKQVRYGLDRAVYFVTAFPCRLPHGHATFAPGSSDASYEQTRPPPRHQAHEHIPAHPLHSTYKYEAKTLSDIIGVDSEGRGLDHVAEPPNPCGRHDSEVWVIDARSVLPPHHHDTISLSSSVSNSSAVTDTSVETAIPCPDESETYTQICGKEILARSWCAEKGRNAIIARVGRTCLSCAIREAKALEISVVIRVGAKN